MKSFLIKILNILTFGWLNRKARKNNVKKDYLTLNTTNLPNIDLLLKSIGGRENIIGIGNSISTISIKIINSNLVNLALLNKVVKKGAILSNNIVTLVVGDCAKELKNLLEENNESK